MVLALPAVAFTGEPNAVDAGPAAPPDRVRYGRDVRRVLSDRCFQCHGADAAARQAKLRLDEVASATADRGGYAAIVPGDVAGSELWSRITSDDPLLAMPPPDAKKRPLSRRELDAIAAWIEQGAEYEPHWAFVAPVRPAVPAVADSTWPLGPIDRFVRARQEAAGLDPSPDADAATLCRRTFLDLTGLPPRLAELDHFVADAASSLDEAHRRLVDRLLATEPYRTRLAEHLASPWLDAARYADTIGIHTDNGRQMWLWRDWVLAALRDNVPYDRFVTEQLAGDLLADASVEQRIASGFNRNHVVTDEGGVIPDEYLVEYAVDRLNTASSVFLGLTMGCARCHDHKYDPITQADFYGMLAFFNSNEEPGLYTQTADARRAYEPFLEAPSEDQSARIAALEREAEQLLRRLEEPIPGQDEQRAAFLREVVAETGVDWSIPRVVSAVSSERSVKLVPQDDGSVQPEGEMPAFEDYVIVVSTDVVDARLLLLEALATAGAESAGGGRAFHGNAVLSSLTLEQRPLAVDGEWSDVPLRWAWSDHTQTNLDFEPTQVLVSGDELGWALDGNESAGERDLVVLAEEPFGLAGGCELRVTLSFRSSYAFHSIGRLRLRVSPLADTARLPVAAGRWYSVGPFVATGRGAAADDYDTAFGPETLDGIDRSHNFGAGNQYWGFDAELADGVVASLGDTVGATYVGRTLWSPDARELEIAVGSDDGFQLWLGGELVAENRVDRGAALGQDRVTLSLEPGANAVVMKVVNTGGPSAFAWQARPEGDVLVGELASALLPVDAVSTEQDEQSLLAWRRTVFDGYRQLDDERNAVLAELAGVRAEIPRTMVMRELDEPRPTYVLLRGLYDHPQTDRPVARATPAFLPPLPEGAPADRAGLAQWLVAPENPLFARVAVNRFWEHLFGAGLVRTSEDFGLQGEWPTHPELLDWLAVEFRESGWDVHGLLRALVTSRTYRQASTVRDDLAERDPDHRLLAAYPRRRLTAEQIRDLALHASGLLVERLGGPSVKPYQPDGLWQEVAMLGSNTRTFQRDSGDALWRRSLYSYWKRAVPPPALMTFDAPTREACVVRRQSTNTPLQALVLWNDEQFVEAARALAARVLESGAGHDGVDGAPDVGSSTRDTSEIDAARIERLFRIVTARAPDADDRALLSDALADFRRRYTDDPAAADALRSVGESPRAEHLDASEHAAWTLLASAVLGLHETLTQD